jgi:hypothetical protein
MMKTQVKIKSFFQGTKARRQFFAGEELVAYDVDQLLTFERGYSASKLSHTTSIATLLGCWRRSRDSWARVLAGLPVGELRDAMAIELADRDEAMSLLADKAQALLERKGANGHA